MMLTFPSPVQWKRRLGLSLILPAATMGAMATSQPLTEAQAQNAQEGGALTIRSDVQEANSETGVITARGNVRVNYPARKIQATAAQAQYFRREDRLVLSGNVHLIQRGNNMRAETVTYLIDEGRFVAKPKSEQQVRSTFAVSEPSDSGNSEAAPSVPPSNPKPAP
ncbi:MAG: organic solvent tolerance protein OstA [Cyanobacteria bacterium QS_3_48_167]|nr:MAG: organic solvent tolerance protein OstA [Cyanobacteria bacterium QS_3_48_167]